MVLHPKTKSPRQKLAIGVATGKIRRPPNNPRRYRDAEIGKVMEAMRRFGFVDSILVRLCKKRT